MTNFTNQNVDEQDINHLTVWDWTSYFSNNEIGNLRFVHDFMPQNPVFLKITLD